LNLLFKKIQSILTCPITLCQMSSPVILESGNTIEEASLKQLICLNWKDPFDNK